MPPQTHGVSYLRFVTNQVALSLCVNEDDDASDV